jgi:hypothetical protein
MTGACPLILCYGCEAFADAFYEVDFHVVIELEVLATFPHVVASTISVVKVFEKLSNSPT